MRYLLLIICIAAGSVLFAQNNPPAPVDNAITVKGRVTDITNSQPVSGASISVGKSLKPVGKTDEDGSFTVKVQLGETLQITHTGYEPYTTTILSSADLVIELTLSAKGRMQEVIVTSYTRKSKETNTVSSVTISGKDLQDVPVSNVMELLQGRAAGVNIQNNTGMPGVGGTINVRGISNIGVSGSGNDAFLTPSSPLFVIDGIPIDPNTNYDYGFNQSGPGISPLSLIPTEDIESIVFLKDAAATSLYGSQGAFGVLLVTTKRGRSKVPIVRYTSNYFFNTPPKLKSVIGGKAEREMRIQQIFENDSNIYSARDKIDQSSFLSDYLNAYYNNSTNWQDIFYGTTFNTGQNLSASGGDTKFNYKANVGYYKEKGIIANTGFTRYSLGLNAEYMPIEKFKLLTQIAANVGKQEKGSGNGVTQNGVASSSSASSLLPPPSFFSGNDAATGLPSVQNDNRTADLRANLNLRYELLKGLNFINSFSYQYTGGREYSFVPSEFNNDSSNVFSYDDKRQRVYNMAQLQFTQAFGKDEDHVFNASVFNEVTFTNFMSKSLTQSGTPNDQYQGPLGYSNSNWTSGILAITDSRILSYAGNFDYQFRKKYIISGSYRLDGTSTNGPNRPFVKNPSLSVRWNFDKEKFLNKPDWLDYGALRVSWGKNIVPTGNIFDSYGRYLYTGRFNNDQTIGFDWKYLANVNLLPQVTTQFTYALEMGFLNGAISTVLETYYKQVDNQLFTKSLSDITGFASFKTNEVGVVNRGYELTLNIRPIFRKTLQWNLSFNAAMNKDVLTRLPDGRRQLLLKDATTGQNILYRLGKNTLSNVLYDYRGVFATDADVPVDPNTGLRYRIINANGTVTYFKAGDPYWTDLNGDYILDENDVVVAGNSQPLIVGGFQSMLKYKNFDLNINTSFTIKRDILNNTLAESLQNFNNPFRYNKNAAYYPVADLNFWSSTNTTGAQYPNPYDYMRSDQVSPFRFNQTLFQEDGSYFKINTVTLSYRLNPEKIKRAGMTSVRVYATANNLHTFSKYSGPDPENVTALGRDGSNGYPSRRTYNLGLDIQF
jgi:TonB-linked SusC/RagA family outer membrane protein